MSEGSRAPRCWAVVPAAGSGQRMGASKPKQYLRLAGAAVIEHTLAAFLDHPRIAGVVVVLASDDADFAGLRCASHAKVSTVVGGDQRSDSVLRGVEALDARAAPYDWVLVHDAARPCLTSSDIDDLLSALAQDPIGGLFAVKAGDTLKNANEERSVGTMDRSNVWRAQTPQMFRVRALREALQAAAEAGTAITDEASALEALGHRPRLVPGPASNIKVTEMGDLQVAEAILLQRQGGAMRVGQGFDVHRFGDGDHVMLGGVRVPHTRGVVAHSDGDVILHALCDALLGASGLGDIGQHFPDTDPKWRGAASAVFVRHVAALLKEGGWNVQNVDVTLLAEEPKLSPHRVAIRECVASLLELAPAAVNLKATTLERMGFIGRGEGLAAQVIATLTPTLHHATSARVST